MGLWTVLPSVKLGSIRDNPLAVLLREEEGLVPGRQLSAVILSEKAVRAVIAAEKSLM